jgi:carbon monoxide dehydrogenase subunit G
VELTNEFSVRVPVDEAWTVLTDLERIAPCMPGLELQEVDGDEYRGVVKVKVGPVVARYRGAASFQELDEAQHRAVVRAEGRETRGQGNAAATVTATLRPEGGGTRVSVHTDLTVTGKVAQFGRGVLVDVSRKLLGQFVASLEADVLSGAPATEAATHEAEPATSVENPTPASGGAASEEADEPKTKAPRRLRTREAEPVDLIATAGSSVVKRLAPIVLVLAVALWWLLRG